MTVAADHAVDVLEGLVVDAVGGTWGARAVPRQREDASAILDPSTERRRHWIGRPRGYSKTEDLAAVTIAAMLSGQLPPGNSAYAAASDQQQARLLLNDIAGFVMRTGLSSDVTVQANRVIAPETGVTLEVLAADDSGAYGLRPALLVLDELCQWPETVRARRFYEALTTALPKVPGSRMVIITTAGDPSHWSRKVFDAANAEPDRWRVSMEHEPPPWLDPKEIEAERRSLLPSSFARLFENRWVASEDRLFKPDDVRACATLRGPQEPVQGRIYVLGVDLALRNDRAVVAVGHREGNGDAASVVVDRLDVFRPTKARDVQMADVQECVRHRSREYNRGEVIFDPAQAWSMMQNLKTSDVQVREHTFTTASNSRRTMQLLQLVRERRLAIPEDDELIDELVALRLVESSPGVYRYDHDAGRHDDLATAVSLVADRLIEKASRSIPAVACIAVTSPSAFGPPVAFRGM